MVCCFLLIFLATLALCFPADAFVLESDCGRNPSHNFYFGRRVFFDQLLFKDNIRKSSSFLSRVEEVIQFPEKGHVPAQVARITYIEALDMKSDGSGACVYIEEGGIDSGRVTILVRSLRGGEINHNITVYGFP